MKKNMGTADRLIRTLIAVVIGILLMTGTISGVLGTILGIVAILLLATSALGLCLGYIPFSISTLRGTKGGQQ